MREYRQTVDAEGNVLREPLFNYGPPLQLDMNKHYTYADYITWNDDTPRELINGLIHLLAAPTTIHSTISFDLAWLIRFFVKKRKGHCRVFHAPVDVLLPLDGQTSDDDIDNVVQPDICVVCDPSKIVLKGIVGAPDLVVEVQSPSTARNDLDRKYHLYERAGVKEYWIVVPNLSVTVFILQRNGRYGPGTLYDITRQPDAVVPVKTIRGLKISLKELFEDSNKIK